MLRHSEAMRQLCCRPRPPEHPSHIVHTLYVSKLCIRKAENGGEAAAGDRRDRMCSAYARVHMLCSSREGTPATPQQECCKHGYSEYAFLPGLAATWCLSAPCPARILCCRAKRSGRSRQLSMAYVSEGKALFDGHLKSDLHPALTLQASFELFPASGDIVGTGTMPDLTDE